MIKKMEIYNVFRMDETNVGDWFCPPYKYFPFLGDKTMEVTGDSIPEQPSILVFGGGGLISPSDTFQKIHRFFDAGHHCIAWGLGENWTLNKDDGYLADPQLHYPKWLSNFDVLGMRDIGNPGEHVPCASCMSSLFDNTYEVIRQYGVYQHKRLPIPSKGYDVLTNNGANFEESIAFLGSCETVITNSYHGVYWAKLLGRNVISIPFASKFYGVDPQLRHCPPWDIDFSPFDRIIDSRAYLTECRQKNIRFAEKVQSYINSISNY